MADVQKLVQTINSDKTKLRAYCEFGMLGEIADRTRRHPNQDGAAKGARNEAGDPTLNRLNRELDLRASLRDQDDSGEFCFRSDQSL
jgi:hypothetical protein